MEKIFGSKNVFAIGIDIVEYEPSLVGESCLWINSDQIGYFYDENILGPFMTSLERLCFDNKILWLEELDGLNCYELFNKLFPFWDNPDQLYVLSDEDLLNLVKFDTFKFHYGENFDKWTITSVINNGVCKFIWVFLKYENEQYSKMNSVQCFDVPLATILEVYKEFCKSIPNEFWPRFLRKL